MPVDAIAVAALVASSVQAAFPVIQAVGAVLTAGRSVIIEVDNNTDLTLVKIDDTHDHGGFAALPKLTIPPHSVDVFGSQSKGGSVGTGTEGSVTYGAGGLQMQIEWNNPFIGGNETKVGQNNSGLGGPDATRFLAVHQTGAGNQQAQARFMLFVHPPYSLKDSFKDRGDLSQGIFKILGTQRGNGIRAQLPNTTAIDAT
jgi:hypothetical protein